MTIPELKPIEGKYEILEKLNEGGMGAVYKVRHRLLEEVRVIKVIRPQLQSDENLRRRFLREARAAVRLRHPNIAELYDFTVADDGTAYMVIEFIDGFDLIHLIEQSSLPNLRLVLDIGIQSLRALAYLHRMQFVHRDISPDNLMLTKDVENRPLVKLIDLGIAKPLKSELNLTGEGLFLGKVRYASPEQFGGQSGKEQIDHRSDLYSFGIVLYELLTGIHPITGDDNQTVLAGHLFHPPRDFAETDPQNRIPAQLRAIVLKALEKAADDRFPDSQAFSNALATFAAQWVEDDASSSSLDATVIESTPRSPAGRPGSTQDRLDVEFAPHPTPPPQPLEAVPSAEADQREAHLQSCCDKIEGLIATKRLLDAEVELQRGRKTLGSSILLEEYSKRIEELRELLNESIVRARLLQREGDFDAALEQIDVARQIDIENSEASALANEIREALDHRDHEIKTSRDAIEVQLEAGQLEAAKSSLIRAQEKLGRFAGIEDLQNRVESLLAATERVRRIGGAASEVGRLIEIGELHRASAALTAAIRTHGDDEMFSELAQQIAGLEEQEREKERAAREAELRRRIRSHLELAEQYAGAENFEGARQQLEQAALLDPESPQIQGLQRQLQNSLERHKQLQLRSLKLEELASEIDIQIEKGDLNAAEELLKAAEADFGDIHELAALRARVDESRLERQEKAAGESLKQAYRYFKVGRLEKALEAVDQALALSPGLPQGINLQQRIVERQREEDRFRALETARDAILGYLNAGALSEAAEALQTIRKEQGPARELQDLEKRLEDLQARAARRQEVEDAARPVEKLIQKNRLKKASTALADAVRSHGQDRSFDELRTHIEDLVKREQEAREILDTDVGTGPSRVGPVRLIAAALIVVATVVGIYWAWRPSASNTGVDREGQMLPEEPAESLQSLLEGREMGEFYALVVGVNQYEKGLPNLETAVNDAQQLAAVLESRYGFATEVLLNVSRYEMLSTLEGYVDRLTSEDNLLIFYAGHGFVDEVTGRGYWQLADAEPDNTANWISSLEVSDILFDVRAQRVLVVADSCFSGAFTDRPATVSDTAPPEMSPADVVDRLDLRTRQVLSSGNLQPVLDNGINGHSVFARALLTALEESPEAMDTGVLFETVRHKVSASTVGMELQQQPQIAPLDSDGGGVFLFIPTQSNTR